MTIDFERDGRVGDKVHDILCGNGAIVGMFHGITHPVACVFENCLHRNYYSTGHYLNQIDTPQLCWGHRARIDIYQGTPPKLLKYPLYRRSVTDGSILEFSAGSTAIVLTATSSSAPVGTSSSFYKHHDSECWEQCDNPKAREIGAQI